MYSASNLLSASAISRTHNSFSTKQPAKGKQLCFWITPLGAHAETEPRNTRRRCTLPGSSSVMLAAVAPSCRLYLLELLSELWRTRSADDPVTSSVAPRRPSAPSPVAPSPAAAASASSAAGSSSSTGLIAGRLLLEHRQANLSITPQLRGALFSQKSVATHVSFMDFDG